MIEAKRQHLFTHIVRKIITDIACGTLSAGDRLPAERILAEEFDVSRGTIRQALADLESIGAIEVKRGSGAYVKKLSAKKVPVELLPKQMNHVSLEQIITARKTIEIATIQLACQHVTAAQLKNIEKLLDSMENAKNTLSEFFVLDMEFHTAIVKASGNVVLATAFDAIFEYHKYSQVFTSENEQCETIAMEHHRRIFQSLKDRNPKAAARVLTQHLDSVMGSI